MKEIPQLPRHPNHGKRGKGKERNRSFEQTHETITEAYVGHLTDKEKNPTAKQPTIAQLAKMTGYATRTIERHLADLDKDLNMARRVKKYRLASDVILKSLLRAAVKGSVAAAETYLKVVEQINFGGIVKVETEADDKGLDLSKVPKADLAAYRVALEKLVASQKGSDGSPQSGA